MADDAMFGPDGTQSLPVEPLLPDPLGGLVTGFTFTDPGDTPYLTTPWAATEFVPAARTQRRPATATRRPGGAGAPGAVTPAATAVAASLPSMTRQERRPSVARATQVAAVAPASNLRARTVPAGGTTWRPPVSRQVPIPRQAPALRSRSTGAGCSVFVLILVVLVVAFVVLGIVLGHGDSSGTGFSGGGG